MYEIITVDINKVIITHDHKTINAIITKVFQYNTIPQKTHWEQISVADTETKSF